MIGIMNYLSDINVAVGRKECINCKFSVTNWVGVGLLSFLVLLAFIGAFIPSK
jgi:hypothetical protein